MSKEAIFILKAAEVEKFKNFVTSLKRKTTLKWSKQRE
jgi:hypothetical protein